MLVGYANVVIHLVRLVIHWPFMFGPRVRPLLKALSHFPALAAVGLMQIWPRARGQSRGSQGG